MKSLSIRENHRSLRFQLVKFVWPAFFRDGYFSKSTHLFAKRKRTRRRKNKRHYRCRRSVSHTRTAKERNFLFVSPLALMEHTPRVRVPIKHHLLTYLLTSCIKQQPPLLDFALINTHCITIPLSPDTGYPPNGFFFYFTAAAGGKIFSLDHTIQITFLCFPDLQGI